MAADSGLFYQEARSAPRTRRPAAVRCHIACPAKSAWRVARPAPPSAAAQVLALVAMVVHTLNGAEAPRRLGAMLRKMEGSPAQIARLMRTRDGAPMFDVAAMLA